MPAPEVLAAATSRLAGWIGLPDAPEPSPDVPAAGGEGLFELLNRLLASTEELLLRAAPIIGAAALIWLAVSVKFAIGRIILVALAILLMVAFTRNIVEGCDMIAREIIGPEGTCRIMGFSRMSPNGRVTDT